MTVSPSTARAQALFDELLADPAYASGERRFPRRLSRDEAADLAEGLAAQVDRGCEARADVGRKQSLPIVCAVGCNGCCEELVLVYQPEAIAVTRWLMRPENQAVRDAFLAAYPAWKAATGGTPAQMAASLAKFAALPADTRVCCTHEYTLSNLRFAAAVEPGNAERAAYETRCLQLREAGQPTLPSSMRQELAINPFLRCTEPEVMASARAQGAEPDDAVSVLAALREWKNRYR